MDLLASINSIDIAIGIVAFMSGIMAWLRGFIREMMGLIGWIIALVLAKFLASPISAVITPYSPSETLTMGIAWFLPFILIALIWFVFSNIVSPALRRTVLGSLDRVLGFGFGLVRGFIVAALIYLGAILLMDGEEALPQQLKEAASINHLRNTTILLVKILPEVYQEEIIALIPETAMAEEPGINIPIPESLDTDATPDSGTLLPDEQDSAIGQTPFITDEYGQ